MFSQVEKAFREGTARQNAHCIFVCLALKLLEERLHVACKEIITLEKQVCCCCWAIQLKFKTKIFHFKMAGRLCEVAIVLHFNFI